MAEMVTGPQLNNQLRKQNPSDGKDVAMVVIVVLVILIVLLVGWLSIKSLNPLTTTTPATTSTTIQSQTTPAINSDADFQKLEDQLNNTNIDSLSSDLDKNDTDAAGF